MVIEASLSLSSQCIFNWAARSRGEQVWTAEGGLWGVSCPTSRLGHASFITEAPGVLPDIQSIHPTSNCSFWLLVDLAYHARAQTADAHIVVHPHSFCTAGVKWLPQRTRLAKQAGPVKGRIKGWGYANPNHRSPHSQVGISKEPASHF